MSTPSEFLPLASLIQHVWCAALQHARLGECSDRWHPKTSRRPIATTHETRAFWVTIRVTIDTWRAGLAVASWNRTRDLLYEVMIYDLTACKLDTCTAVWEHYQQPMKHLLIEFVRAHPSLWSSSDQQRPAKKLFMHVFRRQLWK